MSIDRTQYSEFTGTDIYDRASNVGTKTDNTTYVTWDNILLSLLKTLIGTADESLIDVSTDAAVNEWSNWGPHAHNVISETITPVNAAPYSMNDFAGYNHNAVEPDVASAPESITAVPGASTGIACELDMGELDYEDIGAMIKIRATVKEGATTYGTDTKLLEDGSFVDDNNSIDLQVDFTSSAGWTSTTELTVYLELLNISDVKIADFIVPSFTVDFIPLLEPDIAGETDIDLGELTWNIGTSTVARGSTPAFQFNDVNLFIDEVRYTGISSVYIYKNAESPVYFDDYDMTDPDLDISDNVPFSVTYNDTVILEFRYED